MVDIPSVIREARHFLRSGNYDTAKERYQTAAEIATGRKDDITLRRIFEREITPLVSLLEEREGYVRGLEESALRFSETRSQVNATFGCGSEYGTALYEHAAAERIQTEAQRRLRNFNTAIALLHQCVGHPEERLFPAIGSCPEIMVGQRKPDDREFILADQQQDTEEERQQFMRI